MRRLGAIHSEPPPSIKPFGARASLHWMAIPKRADWFAQVPPDGDDLGNNTLGLCVPVADYREIELRRRIAMGDAWRPSHTEVLARYILIGEYDPTDPTTDRGTDTTADLIDRCTHGIRINSQDEDVPLWVRVDPHDDGDVSIAIAHFGSLLVTIALPEALEDLSLWGKPPGMGPSWEPGSWGVHRVMVGAFDGRTRVCRTWGLDLPLHADIWDRYVLSCDATISRAWLDTTGLAPSGLAWEDLQADMAQISTTG